MNGYAIGISFLLISAYLFWNNTYFQSQIVTYIIGAVIGLFGVASLGTEVDKSKKIKGLIEMGMGAFFLVIWYLIYHYYNDSIWVKVPIFLLLILGAFAVVLGLIKAFHSSLSVVNFDKKMKKSELIKRIILLLSQLLGLFLTTLNILKVFGVLK